MLTEQHILLLAGNVVGFYLGGGLIFYGLFKKPPSLLAAGCGILLSLLAAMCLATLLGMLLR